MLPAIISFSRTGSRKWLADMIALRGRPSSRRHSGLVWPIYCKRSSRLSKSSAVSSSVGSTLALRCLKAWKNGIKKALKIQRRTNLKARLQHSSGWKYLKVKKHSDNFPSLAGSKCMYILYELDKNYLKLMWHHVVELILSRIDGRWAGGHCWRPFWQVDRSIVVGHGRVLRVVQGGGLPAELARDVSQNNSDLILSRFDPSQGLRG